MFSFIGLKRNTLQARLNMDDINHFQCAVCEKDFDRIGHRNRHEQQVHNVGEKYKCWSCGEVFSRWESMHRHRLVHQEYSDEFECAVCEKKFGREDSLSKHQREVHGEVRHRCEICPASFTRKYKLKKHLAKHIDLPLNSDDKASSGNDHEQTNESGSCYIDNTIANQNKSEMRRQRKRKALPTHSTLNSTDSSDAGQSSTNLVKCKACPWEGKSLRGHLSRSATACKNVYDYQALTKDAEIKHHEQRMDWEFRHKKDRNEAKKQKRRSTQITSKKDDHICAQCGKMFRSKFAMSRHFQEAHNNNTIKCPKCQKSFKRREILRYHLHSVHDDPNAPGLVECPYCTKKFSTLRSKVQHIRDVHEEGNDFPCTICQRKFSRKEYLDRHRRDVHFGKKKISCPHCPKTFTRHDNLEVHLSEVHLKKDHFSCPHCKKTFSRKCSLERHIFGAHLRQEEGKRWPCLECPEFFSRKDILDKHMKRGKHSFYEHCEHCDKLIKFKSINAFDTHFVRVRRLSFIDRCRGFSKDTCVDNLKRGEDQLKEFEQGSSTCIHCNETVPNEEYEHWICQDFEAPEKATCINNLMIRTHITCWMCKERFEIKDYFKKENDKWTFNLWKNGNHYNDLKDPSSCRIELKRNRTEYLKKRKHFDGIREKRRKEILNNIPLEKKIDFREYHIIYCNL